MRLRLLVVMALALLVPPLLPLDSIAASRKSCRVAGSTTLAQNSFVRLYSMPNPEGRDLRACLRSNGRKRRLDADYDDGYVLSGGWTGPRLAGRYAAWIHTSTDISCKADCPPGYTGTSQWAVVYDVRRGREVATRSGSFAFVLTDRGALGWLEPRDGGQVLKSLVPGRSEVELDAGAIEPGSLRGYYGLLVYVKEGARLWAAP